MSRNARSYKNYKFRKIVHPLNNFNKNGEMYKHLQLLLHCKAQVDHCKSNKNNKFHQNCKSNKNHKNVQLVSHSKAQGNQCKSNKNNKFHKPCKFNKNCKSLEFFHSTRHKGSIQEQQKQQISQKLQIQQISQKCATSVT